MTSMCLPVHVTGGFYGVVCTDVKLSELMKDVEFFEEGNSSYAFMIDKYGRALVHPLLPDATYVTLQDDPVEVDITTLERSPNSGEIIEKMKRYGIGDSFIIASIFYDNYVNADILIRNVYHHTGVSYSHSIWLLCTFHESIVDFGNI